MGLRLFFLPNFPGATFIQGATFIPDSRVHSKCWNIKRKITNLYISSKYWNAKDYEIDDFF